MHVIYTMSARKAEELAERRSTNAAKSKLYRTDVTMTSSLHMVTRPFSHNQSHPSQNSPKRTRTFLLSDETSELREKLGRHVTTQTRAVVQALVERREQVGNFGNRRRRLDERRV